MGYEMFRMLTEEAKKPDKNKPKKTLTKKQKAFEAMKGEFRKYLHDPGNLDKRILWINI